MDFLFNQKDGLLEDVTPCGSSIPNVVMPAKADIFVNDKPIEENLAMMIFLMNAP